MSSRPTMISNAGVNEPSEALVASMIYTKTTEACPNNWISPLLVPSGVGWVISAAYCMPMGLVLVMKKPIAKAEIYSSHNIERIPKLYDIKDALTFRTKKIHGERMIEILGKKKQ